MGVLMKLLNDMAVGCSPLKDEKNINNCFRCLNQCGSCVIALASATVIELYPLIRSVEWLNAEAEIDKMNDRPSSSSSSSTFLFNKMYFCCFKGQ